MTHWQESSANHRAAAPRPHRRGRQIHRLQDAYKSVYEAISHGGIGNDCGVEIVRLDSEEIEKEGAAKILNGLGGILSRRIRRTRHRGQNQGRAIRARK